MGCVPQAVATEAEAASLRSGAAGREPKVEVKQPYRQFQNGIADSTINVETLIANITNIVRCL